MPRTNYPSDKQDQFIIRMPDGMRDEIKSTAEANNRSMNAEIVARLSGEQRTLRDWFAGTSMRSLLGDALQMNVNQHQAGVYARFAYMVADEMLAAREAKP